MGRFSASLLLLLGACGDNLDVGGIGGASDDIQPGNNGDVVPRYTPQVCGVSQWTPTIAGDPAMDLSVTSRPGGGATLLAVPRSGGSILGFQVDPRMNMETSDVVKVPIETASFNQVVASYVNDRVISTATSGGAVFVHMLDDQLQSPQYIAKVTGDFIGEPAFYEAQGNLVMPVVGQDGLWMHRFQDSLEPIDSKHFTTTKPATSITVSQLGTALMTAWSTADECHLMVNTTYEPGVHAMVEASCPAPRIAVNQQVGDAVMLFDSAAGVRLMPIHITMMGGDAPVIRADAHSPRALFDGTNFWVSYLDSRGDVVVGFLDANRKPVTLSLGDPTPERQAYELIMMDGAPHVFSVDETGYTAYRLCVDAQF